MKTPAFFSASLLLLVLSTHALAKEQKAAKTFQYKSRVILEKYPGFGELKTRVDEAGEPVSEPRRVDLLVSCGADLTFRPLLSDHGTCELVGTRVDQEKGVMIARFKGYDPSTGKCSKPYEKSFQIAEFCRK